MSNVELSLPVLVFGGPYSNLRATEAMRGRAEALGIPPERVVCTGDVVAYCAEPEATVQCVADWGCHVIQGNCEQQLAEGAVTCACNFEEGSPCDLLAKGWYPFANERLTTEMRAWMGDLPRTLRFSACGLTFRVIHGGVEEVNRWVFASQKSVLAEEIALSGSDVVIAGHCGLPFMSKVGRRVWFNPGVIGMPANDGSPLVWYGLIARDRDCIVLSTHRLGYDHVSAAASMRRLGYANGYARALVTGLWPSLDILPEAERAVTRPRERSLRIALPAEGLRDTREIRA